MIAFPFCEVRLRAALLPEGYPERLETVGDHVRKRRLDLGLSQEAAGERMDVSKGSVYCWEKTGREPSIRTWPKVIAFLGYCPTLSKVPWLRG